MDTLDKAREFFDDMPPQAVMLRAITIGMYLDEDGDVNTRWYLHNEGAMLVDWVGLLEFTKQQILYEAFVEHLEGDG